MHNDAIRRIDAFKKRASKSRTTLEQRKNKNRFGVGIVDKQRTRKTSYCFLFVPLSGLIISDAPLIALIFILSINAL